LFFTSLVSSNGSTENNKYSAEAKKFDEAAARAQLAFWDTLMEQNVV
jgi:hypothetical protein